MKKYLVIAFMLFGITSVNAAGVSMGISAMGGLFEVDGAKEEFKGAHSSNSSPGNVTKNASSDGDEAEVLAALASVFLEYEINDNIALADFSTPFSFTISSNFIPECTTPKGSSEEYSPILVGLKFKMLLNMVW